MGARPGLGSRCAKIGAGRWGVVPRHICAVSWPFWKVSRLGKTAARSAASRTKTRMQKLSEEVKKLSAEELRDAAPEMFQLLSRVLGLFEPDCMEGEQLDEDIRALLARLGVDVE